MDGNCWNWLTRNSSRISLCIYFPAVSHAGINCLIFRLVILLFVSVFWWSISLKSKTELGLLPYVQVNWINLVRRKKKTNTAGNPSNTALTLPAVEGQAKLTFLVLSESTKSWKLSQNTSHYPISYTLSQGVCGVFCGTVYFHDVSAQSTALFFHKNFVNTAY